MDDNIVHTYHLAILVLQPAVKRMKVSCKFMKTHVKIMYYHTGFRAPSQVQSFNTHMMVRAQIYVYVLYLNCCATAVMRAKYQLLSYYHDQSTASVTFIARCHNRAFTFFRKRKLSELSKFHSSFLKSILETLTQLHLCTLNIHTYMIYIYTY